MLPSLPCWLAILLEDHHLGIDFILRWQLNGGVAEKKLLNIPDGGDK